MGAYFGKVIKKENKKEVVGFNYKNLNYDFQPLKFLETNFIENRQTQLLYNIFKSETDKDNKMLVNTICDYNNPNDFKHKCLVNGEIEISHKNSEKKINEFFNDFEKSKIMINEIMNKSFDSYRQWGQNTIKKFENMKKKYFIKNGYFVNESKKQYIDMKKLFKYTNDYIVCPLALLTRSSSTRMGGGDIHNDIKPLYNQIQYELFGSWKDNYLYYTTDKNDLKNYIDITELIACYEE